jgi:hypothetical protein
MPRNESSGAKTADEQMMLESPVSRAFGLGKFAIVPIDKPLGKLFIYLKYLQSDAFTCRLDAVAVAMPGH